MNKILIFFLLLFLLSCSVKDREKLTQAAVTTGIREGDKQVVLVKEISGKYLPGEENRIVFRVTTWDSPLRAADCTIKVAFDMPSMPKMGGPWFPKAKWNNDGEFETVFDIAHGGIWTFKLTFEKAGAVVDTVRYTLDIKD